MFPALEVPVINRQGQYASCSGSNHEGAFERLLINFGYSRIGEDTKKGNPKRMSIKDIDDARIGRFYLRQVALPVADAKTRTGKEKVFLVDFAVVNREKYDKGLLIDLKRQDTEGTTEEKLPYAVMRLKEYGMPYVIVTEGQGFSPYIKDWCRNYMETDESGLFRYFESERAFRRQAERGLL